MNELKLVHLTKSSDQFRKFCEEAATYNEPAAENMENVPSLIETRFTGRGAMFVVMDGKSIVGCSGCYLSDFSPYVGLLGVRSWLQPKYRALQVIRNLVLPAQRSWAIERGVMLVALSFNEYNSNLIHLFERQIVKRVPRSHSHMFYRGMNTLPYPVLIQNTPQWVLYEKLSNWDFNWESISVPQAD